MAEQPTFHVPLEEPEQVATPRASASVVVVRDNDGRLEVFMLERHLKSDFAGGAYVFPGGTLDEADAETGLDALTTWPAGMAAQMGEQDERTARALVMCAIRETFEEAGILMARTRDGQPVQLADPSWEQVRAALASGEITAQQMARETSILYAADLLRFWARWVTPVHSPRRYDTRFFIALMPDGQTPLHDDVETTASRWIAPADALAQAREGRFTIIFPTRKMLESLAPFGSAKEIYDAAVGRSTEPVLPRVVTDGDTKAWIILPGDDTLHEP